VSAWRFLPLLCPTKTKKVKAINQFFTIQNLSCHRFSGRWNFKISNVNPEKLLLILDIDETLIHATSKEISNINYDFKVFNYFVYKRPFLNEFLDYAFNNFKVAFWSSASDDYVEKIVHHIIDDKFNPEFVWGRKRCTPIRNDLVDEYGYFNNNGFIYYLFTKQLKKIKKRGFRLERTLIIDDTPSKITNSYGNAVYIDEFTGNLQDVELKKLILFLPKFTDIPNVRIIEKRGWSKNIEILLA
jgi:carboxy-terminal domain RNA polymerase II polypeptide A small phosphatase